MSNEIEWRIFPKILRLINSKSNIWHFHRTRYSLVCRIWLKCECEHNCLYTWKLFHTWSGQCGKTSLRFRCFLRVKNSNLLIHINDKRYVFVIRNGSMLTPPTISIAVGARRFCWTYVDTYSIIKFRKYYWTSKPIALNPWGNYSEKIILQSITHLGSIIMLGPIIVAQIELLNFLSDFLFSQVNIVKIQFGHEIINSHNSISLPYFGSRCMAWVAWVSFSKSICNRIEMRLFLETPKSTDQNLVILITDTKTYA